MLQHTPHQHTDENGVRFDFVVGFPKEAEPKTEWFRPEVALETTRSAFQQLFRLSACSFGQQWRGQGIWGADDNHWILVFERFAVNTEARRQGWGT
ncbi:unnamed protein product [Cercospora beticola]|nr:unnamed protein product [Cercospora beticola]